MTELRLLTTKATSLLEVHGRRVLLFVDLFRAFPTYTMVVQDRSGHNVNAEGLEKPLAIPPLPLVVPRTVPSCEREENVGGREEATYVRTVASVELGSSTDPNLLSWYSFQR